MEGIFPDSEDGRLMIQSMNHGDACMVEFIKTRNYENHKRYFKFIDVAFDMQEFYEEKEHLRKAVQMLAGHFDALVIVNKHGEPETHYIPKSIAFDKMDENEFRELFTKSVRAFLSRYGNGMTEQEFLRVLEFE